MEEKKLIEIKLTDLLSKMAELSDLQGLIIRTMLCNLYGRAYSNNLMDQLSEEEEEEKGRQFIEIQKTIKNFIENKLADETEKTNILQRLIAIAEEAFSESFSPGEEATQETIKDLVDIYRYFLLDEIKIEREDLDPRMNALVEGRVNELFDRLLLLKNNFPETIREISNEDEVVAKLMDFHIGPREAKRLH